MLDKTFSPKDVEGRIYAQWREANAFRAGTRPGAEPFAIMIPPPNITGRLHIGHALNNTLQDILARFERMRGKDVLWQPGTDHAGIATQLIVERQLAEKQMTRQDVLQRVVQGMADVQPARDVWRRNHDRERLGLGPVASLEGAGRLPGGAHALFDVGGAESLVEHRKKAGKSWRAFRLFRLRVKPRM